MNPITERHVQAVWYDAALRPKQLFTRRGSAVTVVSPGEWNLGAGPDFRNAVLEIGRGRAAAILANVIAPFAMAEGRLPEAPDWLPAEDVSEPVRLTAFRFFGRDHNPSALYLNNGLLIQGLLQVRRDHCLQVHPDCDACRLADKSGWEQRANALTDAPGMGYNMSNRGLSADIQGSLGRYLPCSRVES